jgi:hypothetical protein
MPLRVSTVSIRYPNLEAGSYSEAEAEKTLGQPIRFLKGARSGYQDTTRTYHWSPIRKLEVFWLDGLSLKWGKRDSRRKPALGTSVARYTSPPNQRRGNCAHMMDMGAFSSCETAGLETTVEGCGARCTS